MRFPWDGLSFGGSQTVVIAKISFFTSKKQFLSPTGTIMAPPFENEFSGKKERKEMKQRAKGSREEEAASLREP